MKCNPDVAQIVKEWLEQHGYDGLFCSGECGCKVNDLMPCCGEGIDDCVAGYLRIANDDSECDWYIQREKPGKETPSCTESSSS